MTKGVGQESALAFKHILTIVGKWIPTLPSGFW
jgi:hypothetical protein